LFSKYYQDELAFLRDMGRAFSEAHPEAAPFLAGTGGDPDVERLMEGFAFLTARVREKLDDALPEIIHALLEVFFPHYLRPLPAMTIASFDACQGGEGWTIPRHTRLESVPVDGVSCAFRTAYPVRLHPLRLTGCQTVQGASPAIRCTFEINPGVNVQKLDLRSLRLHFGGEVGVARALYLGFTRYLSRVYARPASKWAQDKTIEMPRARAVPVGLDDDQALLPYPNVAFPGYRLLQEYFAFPAKFMFVDIVGLDAVASLGDTAAFDLVFEFSRLPEDMPPVSAKDLLLYCTPAVNLFPHEADPIRVDRERTEYLVSPSGKSRDHLEIFSVDHVSGVSHSTGRRHEFRPLYTASPMGEKNQHFFRLRTRPAILSEGADVTLSIVDAQARESLPDVETLSIELTCTNRQMPKNLGIGDLRPRRGAEPKFGTYRNISRPTPSVPPPLEGDLYWRLVSHLALNFSTLAEARTLKSLLWLYHFRARVDRQAERAFQLLLDGIRNVSATPATHMLEGVPVRGMDVNLELDEDGFGGEGNLVLFGAIFDEFLSQYMTLNSFSQLTLRGTRYGGVFSWPPRIGRRILL